MYEHEESESRGSTACRIDGRYVRERHWKHNEKEINTQRGDIFVLRVGSLHLHLRTARCCRPCWSSDGAVLLICERRIWMVMWRMGGTFRLRCVRCADGGSRREALLCDYVIFTQSGGNIWRSIPCNKLCLECFKHSLISVWWVLRFKNLKVVQECYFAWTQYYILLASSTAISVFIFWALIKHMILLFMSTIIHRHPKCNLLVLNVSMLSCTAQRMVDRLSLSYLLDKKLPYE